MQLVHLCCSVDLVNVNEICEIRRCHEFVCYQHSFNFFKIGCLFWKITHFRLESHATKKIGNA